MLLMEIRRAKKTEARALSQIAMQAKAAWGYSADVLETWRADLTVVPEDTVTNPTFVATIDAEVVGFCSLSVSRGLFELDNLSVLPKFMRQGSGTRLLSHVLSEAFKAGATEVMVDADPNAERFYRERGGVRRGEVYAPIPGNRKRVRPQMIFSIQTQQFAQPDAHVLRGLVRVSSGEVER